MVMFKPVGVLLAVSAIAVLVQSSDDLGEIELSGDACIELVVNKLEAFQIGMALNALVLESREHYDDSIRNILRGRTSIEYREAMRKLGPKKGCRAISRQFREIYWNQECAGFIDRQNDATNFMLEVSNFSQTAKSRIEAYYACKNASGEFNDDGGYRGDEGGAVGDHGDEDEGDGVVEDQ